MEHFWSKAGNLKTAMAFLAGLSQQDLVEEEFSVRHPRHPLIVSGRVIRQVDDVHYV